MGLPSKKRTPRSKRDRASHFALKKTGFTKCSECASPILPHTACGTCGKYRGRQAVNIKKRIERKMRNKTK